MLIEIRPLVAFRDYHSLARGGMDSQLPLEVESGLARIAPRGSEDALFLAHDATRLLIEGVWYRQFEYAEERARGFDYQEDLFNPFVMLFEARNGTTCSIIASTERGTRLRPRLRDASASAGAGRRRRRRARRYVQTLCAAADQFVVQRGQDLQSSSPVPLVTDWGRDTMISLPGLAPGHRNSIPPAPFCSRSPNT